MTDLAASGVGAELAAARETRGLALTDVAQQLKFSPRQLEALEQERFDLLPGGTFVRGMVRAYARLLKVEAEPLLGRIADRFDAPDANSLAARYKQPVPFSDGARRSTFIYLGMSLGVLLAVGALGYQWYREQDIRHVPVAAAPRAKPPVVPVPAEPVAAKAPEPVAAKEAPVAVKEMLKEQEKDTGKVQEKDRDREKVASLRTLTPGMHRIVLRCEGEAWLEVTDASGRQLVSSLNPPGCERVVQGRGPFTLVIGNASHVQVTHNDRPVDLQPYIKLEIARFTLP